MNVKDIIEVLKILRLNVCAQNVRSMHVDCKKQFLALKRRLHAPDASPVEEESFDIRLFFALGCFECTAQSAGISDVFGNDELAVAFACFSFQTVKFFDHFLCQAFKMFQIFICPPVGEISEFVKLRTVVVKGVRNFMCDYGTDAAVVFACGLFQTVERSLKDGCREDDDVKRRIIVCVYLMSRHLPTRPIDRLSVTIKVVRNLNAPEFNGIVEQILCFVNEILFVERIKLIRIADVDAERIEFDHGFFGCFLAEPVVCFKTFFINGNHFFDHMLNVCFGIRSEIFVRIVKTDDLVVACRCKMICGFFRFHCFLCTGKRA